MTNSLTCRLYYSVTGEPFSVLDKNDPDAIICTDVQLNIYTVKRDEAETETDLATEDIYVKTELSIAHDIPAEKFFTSETWGMLLNEGGEILTVDGKDIFAISLYRNIDKPQQLKVKFPEKLIGRPYWSELTNI